MCSPCAAVQPIEKQSSFMHTHAMKNNGAYCACETMAPLVVRDPWADTAKALFGMKKQLEKI